MSNNGWKLPPEIIEEILYRLPAKSLGCFRCVSKPWRSLISKPQFIKTHLHRTTHRHRLILVSDYQSLYSVDLDTDQFNNSDVAARKLRFRPRIRFEEIYGSCNGLILAADQDNTMFLLNPTTRESTKLPISPLALDPRHSEIMYGLGYDSSADDYKVVTISYYDPESEYRADCSDMFVDVYTLKTNCWRRVRNSPYDHAVGEPLSGVFINSSLHYLSCRISDYSAAIVAFNLGDEGFYEVPLPSLVEDENTVFNKLVVLNGCLCFLDFRNVIRTDVWMMKDYGVRETWTKIVICKPNLSSIEPLHLLGDREILVENDKEEVLVYNLEERRSRDIAVHGIPTRFEVGGAYVESLVSPKCQSGNEGQ